MKRGEIWCTDLKKPDTKRPVLILTHGAALEYLNEITVAPLTTTIRDIPTEILLTKTDGLPQDCCINLDHIQTVSKSRIGSLITTLHEQKLIQVRDAVLFALDY